MPSVWSSHHKAPEEVLQALGIELPAATGRTPTYDSVVQTGQLVFIAGRIPRTADGTVVRGRVGETIGITQAREAARLAAVRCLSELKDHLKDLRRVRQIVRVFGMVNASPEFRQYEEVIDGATELFIQVFGDRGRHSRCLAGMSLIEDAVLELEVIVEVED